MTSFRREFLKYRREEHTRPIFEVENKIDPDYGKSWLCNACRLPIFSTPFVTTTTVDPSVLLHDQCTNDHLPPILKAHPLHPGKDLILHPGTTTSSPSLYNCNRCDSICGSRFYICGCGYDNCEIKLDLSCALTIKILHKSHAHRLTAIKGKSLSSLFCTACGTQHQLLPDDRGKWDLLSYVCSPCDFWIHPDCALLPNAIILIGHKHHHPHPLLLTYSDLAYSHRVLIGKKCAICDHPYDNKSDGSGFYLCYHCRYSAHIKCVVYSDPHHISFKPVLIRAAQIPNLVRLPMPNEYTSVMKTVVTNYVGGDNCSNSNNGDHTTITSTSTITDDHQSDKIHEHPLIFHDHHQGDHQPAVARVCNACVQLISPSDPFYSCANNNNELAGPCIDFFLHRCCAHLPATLITDHWAHRDNSHPLTLLSKVDMHSPFNNMFLCYVCNRQCNGFAYACEECGYYLDVVCAIMSSASITHDAHAKSHILQPILGFTSQTCICCAQNLRPLYGVGYGCNNCRNFIIHAMCALLPDTVTHKFDRHPLKLITTTTTTTLDHHPSVVSDQEEEPMFCEICERDIDNRLWYYGCKECDQCFHTRCIPTLDHLSKIKFGFTTTVRVPGHDCPLACVRALSVHGYPCQCGHCERIIREYDKIAFECSECYFRIHKKCAKELLLRTSVQKS
ncbi:hypothetical protein PHJA_001306900 [Phtheirospermum japonicum]|uniref:Phorbol-ester/DAG-type domain-containing protein n=1 Tax=Phtheirospermum japonicum TaxID=374723 RepID=A0A830BYH7_9LAMI|nr:hypothetical protein PHJA_001306900 [Phtheirospermum japonicum]